MICFANLNKFCGWKIQRREHNSLQNKLANLSSKAKIEQPKTNNSKPVS